MKAKDITLFNIIPTSLKWICVGNRSRGGIYSADATAVMGSSKARLIPLLAQT
jgi:hypothetical protein